MKPLVTTYQGWRWCRGGVMHHFMHRWGSRHRKGYLHEVLAIDADEGEG